MPSGSFNTPGDKEFRNRATLREISASLHHIGHTPAHTHTHTLTHKGSLFDSTTVEMFGDELSTGRNL